MEEFLLQFVALRKQIEIYFWRGMHFIGVFPL